jgi:hypothetical protein
MTPEEMEKEMAKPVYVAMSGLQWYLLLALFEQVLGKDDIFATEQDREACRETFKTIHNQAFNKEDKSLADILTIKPKKIITKPDIIL